jgi:hypothetical protein
MGLHIGAPFIGVIFAFVAFLGSASLSAAPAQDYLTEDELDLVRDAQEIDLRIPVYVRLAEKRLVVLGVMEKGAKDKERELKEREKWEKVRKKRKKPSERYRRSLLTSSLILKSSLARSCCAATLRPSMRS